MQKRIFFIDFDRLVQVQLFRKKVPSTINSHSHTVT